jgi:hypothetical protein
MYSMVEFLKFDRYSVGKNSANIRFKTVATRVRQQRHVHLAQRSSVAHGTLFARVHHRSVGAHAVRATTAFGLYLHVNPGKTLRAG